MTTDPSSDVLERLHEGLFVQLLRQKLDLSDGLLDDLEESGSLQETARAIIGEFSPTIERLSAERAWQPIETAPMWEVAVVTDGERAAVAQRALNDWREAYWSCDPEDGLDWEPTHWMPLPEAPQASA